MVFLIIGILLFYGWSFLGKRSRLHKLLQIMIAVMTAGMIGQTLLAGYFAIPSFWKLSQYLIYMGLAGIVLLRSRESRYTQVLILLSIVLVAIRWGQHRLGINTSSGPVSITQVDELLCAVDGSVAEIEEAYGVDLTIVVKDIDPQDVYPISTIYSVDIDNDLDASAVASTLRSDSRIRWVEHNDHHDLQWRNSAVVNDPRISEQWAWQYLEMDKYHSRLRLADPQRPAKLFIIDSGSESSHEDLGESYVSHRKESDVDDSGHGTHCAGVAAAITDNKIGVASFSPGKEWVEVTGIKVINVLGFAPQSAILEAIQYAVDQGADVISLSLGAFSLDAKEHAYNEVLTYTESQGVIVVAAAGNSNRSAAQHVPAGCKHVISVAAVDRSGSKASFSNTNEDVEMGVAAPGVDIVSTFRLNTYKSTSGTSMATPMVAGLAAICKALDPTLTGKRYFDLIEATGMTTDQTVRTGKVIRPTAVVSALIEE